MLKTLLGITSSNTYIWCRKNVCFLIDPSDNLETIEETLKDKQLKGILLTHAHADHMHLLSSFDVPIYLHEHDFELLKKPAHIGYRSGFPYKLQALNIIKMPEQLELEDLKIRIIHTPGHSPGSICLYADDILISGDTLFKESIGRTDVYLASESKLKQSIIHLMTLPNGTKVYPGHGEKTTIRHEKSHNLFVKRWLK